MRFQQHHHTRARRQNSLPLVILIGSIAVILGSFFVFKLIFASDEGSIIEGSLILENQATASMRLDNQWRQVSSQSTAVAVVEGDEIRSDDSFGVKIALRKNAPNQDYITLDKNSEIAIEQLREKDGAMQAVIALRSGRAWVNIERNNNPNFNFTIYSPANQLAASTSNASFSFADTEIAVQNGNAVSITLRDLEEGTFSKSLQFGQMIEFTSKDFSDIRTGGPGPESEAISVAFNSQAWYAYNTGMEVTDTEDEDSEDDEDTDSEDDEDSEEDEDADADEDTTSGDLEIIEPSLRSTYSTSDKKITIEGTVPDNATKIIVDDYTLQQFSAGDETWSFNVSEQLGNRESKEFIAEAYDEDDNLIATDSIDITFTNSDDEDDSDSSDDEDEDDNSDNDSSATSSSSLKITAPNGGADYTTSADPIVIEGIGPSSAARVEVNGYELSSFTPDSPDWRYNISSDFNNRPEPGESIDYKATAYDEDGNEIASETITITIEEGASTTSESTETSTTEATDTTNTSGDNTAEDNDTTTDTTEEAETTTDSGTTTNEDPSARIKNIDASGDESTTDSDTSGETATGEDFVCDEDGTNCRLDPNN
jgi:hypothetical protein